MSTNQSIDLAKVAALDQIKQMAAEDFGSYVQSTRRLINDTYSEEVKVLTAANVHTNILSEQLTLSEERLTLHLKVQVFVNEKALQDRIQRLQQDQSILRDIQKLRKDNISLRHKLIALSNAKPSDGNLGSISQQLIEQGTLLRRYDQNYRQAAGVFVPGQLITVNGHQN